MKTTSSAWRVIAAAVLASSLMACIVVPRTTQTYDPDCQIYVRQMTLQAQQIGYFAGCANDGCVVLLATAGVIAAGSAVVSGSIAVVGNVVYWAEKQQRCVRVL